MTGKTALRQVMRIYIRGTAPRHEVYL